MSLYLETAKVLAYIDGLATTAMEKVLAGDADSAVIFSTCVVIAKRIGTGEFDWSGESE